MKFRVVLEVFHGKDGESVYTVRESVNTLHPLPGQVLKTKQVEELVSRAKSGPNRGQVIIREGRRL